MTPAPIVGTEDEILEDIREWLRKHDARCMWSTDVANVGAIQAHLVRGSLGEGKLVLLQIYYDRHGTVNGWDVYIPATCENSVDITMQSLDAYLGEDA